MITLYLVQIIQFKDGNARGIRAGGYPDTQTELCCMPYGSIFSWTYTHYFLHQQILFIYKIIETVFIFVFVTTGGANNSWPTVQGSKCCPTHQIGLLQSSYWGPCRLGMKGSKTTVTSGQEMKTRTSVDKPGCSLSRMTGFSEVHLKTTKMKFES